MLFFPFSCKNKSLECGAKPSSITRPLWKDKVQAHMAGWEVGPQTHKQYMDNCFSFMGNINAYFLISPLFTFASHTCSFFSRPCTSPVPDYCVRLLNTVIISNPQGPGKTNLAKEHNNNLANDSKWTFK